MIVTFTANPSIDRTIWLAKPLRHGQVQRAEQAIEQPGGKGVNVATVTTAFGLPTTAVLGFHDERYAQLIDVTDPKFVIRARSIDGPYRVRVNTSIIDPGGTITKVNEIGPRLSGAQVDQVTDSLTALASTATWVVLSGALHPDLADWYCRIAARLAGVGVEVAIDSSDAALASILRMPGRIPCSLLKPNIDEFAQLTGLNAGELELAASRSSFDTITDAARSLCARGVANVLVTLGAAGAVLVNERGAWHASPPPITVASPVGAGDSALAGFVIAAVRGGTDAERLALAVACGAAAAELPATGLPTPNDVRLDQVTVRQIC